jgi:hypothetical protein
MIKGAKKQRVGGEKAGYVKLPGFFVINAKKRNF